MASHDSTETDYNDQSCDFTPVDLAADQIASLIAQQLTGTFHIANPEPTTYAQLREMAPNFAKNDHQTSAEMESLALRRDNSPMRIFKTTGTRISVANTLARLASHP